MRTKTTIRGLFLLGLLGVAVGSPSAFAQKVYQPDFSRMDGALPRLEYNREKWKVVFGNVLQTVASSGRPTEIVFGEDDWKNLELEFRVRQVELFSKNNQHFGVILRRMRDRKTGKSTGIKFYCRGKSVFFQEKVDGRTTRSGLVGMLPRPMEFGKDGSWVSFRISLKGRQAKVFADNRLIGTVQGIVPQQGRVALYAFNLDIALGDLKVLVFGGGRNPGNVTERKTSRNILPNSSFEQCTLDRLPDYWGCNHWGISDPYWVVHYDEWVQNYGVDSSNSFKGKNSMRINNPFDRPDSSGLLLRSTILSMVKGQPYTLSAFMKSDPAGMAVSLNGKRVVLSDDWKRYSESFAYRGDKKYDAKVELSPLGKGTFWVDCIQLEEGDSATAYQSSFGDFSLEVQEGNDEKEITSVEKFEPQLMAQSVVLDGRLDDDVWRGRKRLELKTLVGKEPVEKTDLCIWYAQEGIYIGIRCFDEATLSNKCKIRKHDGTVWSDPSVEIFIDPQLSRNYYYQLAFNQAGVRYDAYCGDISWNGTWKVATYNDPQGRFWSAEVFLPFGEMGIDQGTSEWWGLNVCRNNRNKKESSAWSPTFGGFHVPERFAQVRISPEVLKKYHYDIASVALRRATGKGAVLSAVVQNKTDADKELVLECELTDGQGSLILKGERELSIGSGQETPVSFEVPEDLKGTEYGLWATLLSTDRSRVFHREKLSVEIPDPFEIMPQYSLYTHEGTMKVRLRTNLDADSLLNAECVLALSRKGGKPLVSTTVAALTPETYVVLDIENLPAGDYVLNAALKDSEGKIRFDAERKITRLPPCPNEVKIDHLNGFVVVDGKPFFPMGFAWEGALTAEVLEYLAKNGCNVVSVKTDYDRDKMAAILENAEKCGIKVRIQLSVKHHPIDEVVDFMKQFMDAPALLAWATYDEVFTGKWGKEHYDLVRRHSRELKEVDPYHPVYLNENKYGMSYLRSKNLYFPGDIVSLDYYAWTPSGNLQMTTEYLKTMEKMARAEGRPRWIFLLGAGYAYWASRDYTPAEQEFSTYTSIINGASAIFYWASHPKSISQWNRIKSLFREVEVLRPVLASYQGIDGVGCSAPSIQVLGRKAGESYWLITVNSSEETVDAKLDLSPLGFPEGAVAEVRFEGRTLEVENNMLVDRYEGFERHVYEIKAGK